jgi:hypothetical protein
MLRVSENLSVEKNLGWPESDFYVTFPPTRLAALYEVRSLMGNTGGGRCNPFFIRMYHTNESLNLL